MTNPKHSWGQRPEMHANYLPVKLCLKLNPDKIVLLVALLFKAYDLQD
jgi:hypothetical protein